MSDPITRAQCICRAVTLSLEGAPLVQYYCHCDDCQAAAGAPLVGMAIWPSERVRVEGPVHAYTIRRSPRARCATCGTRLTVQPPEFPVYGVVASILPAGMFKPMFHIFCEYATVRLADDLPRYRRTPALMQGNDERMPD